jgi:PAS domain S-box-containing protein
LLTDKLSGSPPAQVNGFTSEQIFRAALKNTSVTIFVLDPELRYTWIYNPSVGQPAEKFIGKKVGEMSKPKDASALINFYSEVLKSGAARHEEFRLEFEDKVAFYEIYVLPLKNSSDEVTGLVAASTDVTHHKKAEEEIARLASFPKLNPNPVIEADFEGNIEYANPSTKKLFPDLETLGSRHPFLSDWKSVVKNLEDEKGAFSREIKVGKHWYHQQFYVDPKSKCVRVYAENFDNLKRAEAALRESEQRWATTLLSIGDAVIATDVAGRVEFMNSVAETLTGWNLSEVFQTPLNEVFHIVNEESRLEVENPVTRVLKEGMIVGLANHTILVRRDGSEVPIDDSGAPIKDKDGEKTGVVLVFRDITERKKAEQELWQANNDWERTFDSVPDFIAILDNQYRIVRANRAMAQQLGVTPEKAIGLFCYQCVHGLDNPPDFCPHSQTVKDGKEHRAEVHEPRLGGDFLVSTTPLRDEKGRMVGSVHVARNITERKKAEEALSKLNRHLRAISNSNQALMHATDEATLTKEVCNIISHDCGYALVWVGFAEQDKEKTVRPVAYAGFDKDYIDQLNITWADKPRGCGPTGTVIRTGKPYFCRDIQTDPNFKPWCEQATKRGYTASLVLPLSTFENKTFGALNIYSTEPNPFSDEEIKLLTELANDFAYGIEMLRLRKEREQAAETQRKQAALIDLSPDAIIMRELGGKVTFWSKGAEKLYGWTKEEALGEQTHLLIRTKFTESFDEIKLKIAQNGYWSGELTQYTKDGGEVVVQSWWMGKPNEQGKIKEILESNVDITERKRIQTKLEENAFLLEEYANRMEELANERAKQLKENERLVAIGQTAGMVGHDIRNPLQAIVGELYLSKDELASMPDGDAKKNLQESMTCIEENLFYIDKIIADLQDYTKPLKPNKEKVNIEKVIEEALLIVPVPNNLQVSISIEEGFPQFTADFSMLKRALMNLIQNAVQAMANGGSLNINAKCKGKHACISVEDTGEGIPEEVKSKLFTPLFTTKSKGQGFGLAVVKRLVETQGGKISFKSEKGKGTTFTIQLPLT